MKSQNSPEIVKAKEGINMHHFRETKRLFENALLGYPTNTWFAWLYVPKQLKAAALYVQFYDQITLAWSKYQKPFMEEETAVSTVLQYIHKNVNIIEHDSKRYTAGYMYQVAKNAIYPLGRIQRDIDYYRKHCPLYEFDKMVLDQLVNDDDIDDNPIMQDRFFCDEDIIDVLRSRELQSIVWAIIECLDDDEKDYVDGILNGRIRKRLERKSAEILPSLRVKFACLLRLL